MDSNGYTAVSSSSSTYTNNGFTDHVPPQFTDTFGTQQPQGMQWSSPIPQSMNPFVAAAAQTQNSHWSQPQQLQLSGAVHARAECIAPESMLPESGVYVDAIPIGRGADDDRLAQALHDSTHKGQTYKQAIEGLHGANYHPAHEWKDYYLDHAHRIDVLVSRRADPVVKTVKKPCSYHQSTDTQSIDSTHKVSSMSVTRRRKAQKKPYQRSNTSQSRMPAVRTNRPPIKNTIKLSAPLTSIPTLPLRSPSPPATVVTRYPNSTSYLFTDQDKMFFFKTIQWELSRDPSLVKYALCDKLGKKAPHHSPSSWVYFWNKEHVLADEILTAAQNNKIGDGVDESEDSEHWTGEEDTRSNTGFGSDASTLSDLESRSSGLACLEEAPGGDESAMGKMTGDGYIMADNRVIAKYIATFDGNWSASTAKERWAQFCNQHPQREYSSWQKRYKREKEVISKLVRKYRKRDGVSALKSPSVELLSDKPSSTDQSVPLQLPPNTAKQAWADEGEKMAIDALNSLRESREPPTA